MPDGRWNRRKRLNQAGLRWIASDARDVARIEPGVQGTPVAIASASLAVARWRGRVERHRLMSVVLRSALVALAAACLLQVVALASGGEGVGLWLLPAALVAVVCLALGLSDRTTPGTTARMLDRDLDLGAKVSTALELESEAAPPRGLGTLALADGRGALAESLAGARARLRPRRTEAALLAVLIVGLAALLLVPSPRSGGSGAATARRTATAAHAGSAVNGKPAGSSGIGATLSGFGHKQSTAPSLTALAPGSTQGAGTLSGHSPYGSGVASKTTAGSIQPVSQTVGPVGSLEGTSASDSSSAAASEGKGANAKGSVSAKDAGGAGQASSSQGAQGVSPVAGGQPASTSGQAPATGTAAATGGNSKGGNGSSAPGAATGQRSSANRSTPGGATAGGTRGAQASGQGVVPQLRAGTALPLQPGYEAVKGARGAPGENASASEGGGGSTSRSGTASAGSWRRRRGRALRAAGRQCGRSARPRARAGLLRLVRARERKRLVT